jgi:hypothetical protein
MCRKENVLEMSIFKRTMGNKINRTATGVAGMGNKINRTATGVAGRLLVCEKNKSQT